MLEPLLLRVATKLTLSTASLVVGQEVDVLVKLDPETTVRAIVRWRSAEQFIATSEHAVHRGWVGQRLGGKGPAFCEAFAAELDALPEILAAVERRGRGAPGC